MLYKPQKKGGAIMANREFGYQYETSPRKLDPDYKKINPKQKRQKKLTQEKKMQPKVKNKKKFKMSFEMKFFINSMLFFSIIFAIIACQAFVEQKYKEKEKLRQTYNEMLSTANMSSDFNSNMRVTASEYGMQTKSATLIDLGTSDYIETPVNEVEKENGFLSWIMRWFEENF